MKDLIIDRLNKMEDLEQRKILKNILMGAFVNLIDYNDDMYKKLEERVFDDVSDLDDKYDICMTVCNKNQIDPLDDFLYPMFMEDLKEKIYDSKEIIKSLNSRNEIKIATVFMLCDYLKIKEILKSNGKYKGEITTNERTYLIEVKIKQNTQYINEIERLYNIYQVNGFKWRTINASYLNKFFDVIITQSEQINEEETIEQITYKLGEYESYKMADIIPLWNVERLKLKCKGFPIAAEDKVNFEHQLLLKDTELDNGLLIDEDKKYIEYIKHMEKQLTIVSKIEKADMWNVLEIKHPSTKNRKNGEFEIATNSCNNNFLSKFANKHCSIIRTKGEIKRIVKTFEASKYFELENIEIDVQENFDDITYDMNSFILDDIRLSNTKKTMMLEFKDSGCDKLIIYDLLSFLISEIQIYFPEYKCKGKLL